MQQELFIKVHRQKLHSILKHTLLLWMLLFFVGLFSFALFPKAKLEILFLIIVVPTLILVSLHCLYLLLLSADPEAQIIFDAAGIVDGVSPIRMGLIRRREIESVQIEPVLFLGPCLEIRLHRTSEVWQQVTGPRSILIWPYRALFFSSVCIPLNVLDGSREHLKALMRSLNTPTQEELPSRPMENLEAAIVGPAVVREISVVGNVSGESEASLPLEPLLPGKSQEKESYGRRLFAVHQSQLCHFGTWSGEKSAKLPAGVTDVATSEQTRFKWQQSDFEFGLDMQGGEDLVALRLAVDGEETLVLLLQMQIDNTMEFVETQVLKSGPWQVKMENLFLELSTAHS